MFIVRDLIERLKMSPPDAVVILSKDEEGNGFSLLESWSYGDYDEKSGDFLEPKDEHDPTAICLWP